ncbi:amidohydrolase family protein [Aquabacterium sp.]|uniref:amidohydrolase family protein n=1 Tax=Aquabacterium sp. TaxID=1872578 RepID=UPI002C89CF87|nr:amidohydrolase family protein [Aquabacterium sp.]HSW03099.1 amidohydrolase family protein [Aquabacterium sp.]
MNTAHLTLRALLAAAAASALMLALPAHADSETRFTITIQTQVGGQLLRRVDGQNQVRVEYSYRDNGRGPDISEQYTLGADGALQSYRVSGKSTFGGEIKESFQRQPGRVQWTSTVDRGDQAAPPEAMYLPVEYSPDWFAQLVHGVWAQPGHAAPALPGGRFTVERLDTLAVRSAAGVPAQVGLYALTGADLTPSYVWLREDAGQPLFAMVFPGWQLAEQGFEAEAPRLLERQQRAQNERLRTLATKLARPLPGLTLIRNVRWFDAAAARMRGPSDVTLFDGRIGAVLPAGSGPAAAEQTLDGSGKTLLPGLFDMHAHIYPDQGLLHLAAGVTSVRDMGNVNPALHALKARFDAGTELGPHVVPLGFIEGKSPFSSNFGILAATLDEARRAVDWYAVRGYRQLKLYNSIKPEWVKPLTAYAHQRGLRVGGHVPAFMRAEQAVRDGYDELNHINQLMLNFFVKPQDDTRTLLRFTLVGDESAKVDLDGPRVKAFLALLRKKGTVVDPTLDTFEAMFTQRSGQANPSLSMVAEHLPVSVRRSILANSMDVNDGNAARYRQSYAAMLAFVGRMHRAGIPLLAGTDDFAGFALHRELELYVKAGIPAAEVLKIATYNGARYSGTLAETGTITAGKRADLVLIDGDPSVRIQDIRRVSLVFKGGVALAPDAMFEAMGVQAFVPALSIKSSAAGAHP